MFCSNCGAKLRDGANFCTGCGAQVLNRRESAAPEPAVRMEYAPKTETVPKMEPAHAKLVAAKCTNCGAALTVDPGQQAAVCSYCGMPYIVEKAIRNYTVTNVTIGTQINVSGPDAGNLLSLARSSLRAGQYERAVGYAERALETNPASTDAWIVKILAAGYDIEGDRSSEIAAYVESALSCVTKDQDEEKVYGAVLDVSRIHIQQASKSLKTNTESIRRQLDRHRAKQDIAAMDSGYVIRTTEITNEAIEYREIVPDDIIISSAYLKEKVIALSEAYTEYITALGARYSMYGAVLSPRIQARKIENQRKILSGLDTESLSGSDKAVAIGKDLFGKLFR